MNVQDEPSALPRRRKRMPSKKLVFAACGLAAFSACVYTLSNAIEASRNAARASQTI